MFRKSLLTAPIACLLVLGLSACPQLPGSSGTTSNAPSVSQSQIQSGAQDFALVFKGVVGALPALGTVAGFDTSKIVGYVNDGLSVANAIAAAPAQANATNLQQLESDANAVLGGLADPNVLKTLPAGVQKVVASAQILVPVAETALNIGNALGVFGASVSPGAVANARAVLDASAKGL